jgi:hypothetical protein
VHAGDTLAAVLALADETLYEAKAERRRAAVEAVPAGAAGHAGAAPPVTGRC